MEVLVKLYNMTKPAADGSTIDRQVTEEYLASEDYQEVIKDQLALGGTTHKDRKVTDEYSSVVGPDDQILISNNVTHYIKKIYTTPDSDFCFAIVEILDPENYSGERKDNIMNLIADLKSGIKLPCSVVIQALWSYENRCEKIIRIKGLDWTLNPSFEGAGLVKVFSSVIPDLPETSVKSFSSKSHNLEGCVMKTVKFSITAEVIDALQVKTYSLSDIARKYGRMSDEYLKAKSFSGTQYFTEDYLKNIAQEDEEIPYEEVERPSDYFEEGEKDFSTVNSVRDRMYFAKYPRLVLINRILKAYKSYYDDKHEQLTSEQFKWLQTLLIQDMFILLKNVSGKLIAGNNLSSLYGLQQFGEEVKTTGDELSKIYRQVLLSEQILGFIPEGKYNKWKKAYKNFLLSVMKYCFGIEAELPNNLVSQI